ncbi:MAG: hypothetical protein WA865_18010 [Spirulinaceae cyanobacterium]
MTNEIKGTINEDETYRFSLQKSLNDFVASMGNVLTDITALEVNTMVVDHISGDKFMPWKTYQDIYAIDRSYLKQHEVHQSLWEPYMELRKELELNYISLLGDPDSSLYSPQKVASMKGESEAISDPNGTMEEMVTGLPNPFDQETIQAQADIRSLFADSRFLRCLRKMGELKTALDNRNRSLIEETAEHESYVTSEVIENTVKTDIIYAQTVIQLDGDIINRFSDKIFDHPHRDLILQIHKISVENGEKEWRGLLGFVIDIVQTGLEKGIGTGLNFLGRSNNSDQN